MTEFVTAPDGVRVAYDIVGEGEAIVLVHGFGASRVQNWREPGWYDTLTVAGYQVVALDCRGHGESDKPHDLAAYGESAMANDIALVMRAAGHERAFVMGYSMGGSLVIRLMHDQPRCVRAAILGGVGSNYFTRSNAALAACMRAPREPLTRDQLAAISIPALVVCGETDDVSGPAETLASALGNARGVTVPKRDHMRTVGDKVYKQVVLEFFARIRRKPVE